eukprot:9220732-Alexandrium_andersonii.AAC.1
MKLISPRTGQPTTVSHRRPPPVSSEFPPMARTTEEAGTCRHAIASESAMASASSPSPAAS